MKKEETTPIPAKFPIHAWKEWDDNEYKVTK